MAKNETVYSRDAKNKTLTVVRNFDAPLELVWKAWTTSELLDQWWAPKPYTAHTKSMDFSEGGCWLYYMAGPNNFVAWVKVTYSKIQPYQTIVSSSFFTDDAGVINDSMPAMHWDNQFIVADGETKVNITIHFDTEADLETIVKMGFQEGLSMGFGNLDEVLATR